MDYKQELIDFLNLVKSPVGLSLIILANTAVMGYTAYLAWFNGGSVMVHFTRVFGWLEWFGDAVTMVFYTLVALWVLWEELEVYNWYVAQLNKVNAFVNQFERKRG